MLHRVLVNPTTFDFATYPIQIGTNVPTNVVWTANSTGNVIRSSGYRLWDSNLLSATGSQLIQPGTPLTLPFSAANLPPYTFDAIVTVATNGMVYPQGFSNSPDNQGVYATSPTTTDKILFWGDLFCFNYGNQGNSSANADYMFGGLGRIINSLGSDIAINFANPLADTISASYQLEYYRSDLGRVGPVFTGSATFAPGSRRYLFLERISDITADFYNSGLFYYPYNYQGYFKISLSVNNSNYRSLLPYYHWGVG